MAGKGLERLITTISDQLGTIEVGIDNVYYGNPLKKNQGIQLPGNRDKINGILPLVQELAKLDLCNIVSYVLNNTDLSSIAGKDSGLGKKVAKLKKLANDLANKLDTDKIGAEISKALNKASTAVVQQGPVKPLPKLPLTATPIYDVNGTLISRSEEHTSELQSH